MGEVTEEKINDIFVLKQWINLINKELKSKGIYGCEYMLINNSVDDVFRVIEDNSEIYYRCRDIAYGKTKLKDYLEQYFVIVKRYYDTLYIKEEEVDKYFDHLTNSRLTPNTSKSQTDMIPEEVERTLKLMKEAAQVYYKVYENKELIAELSTSNPDISDYLNFRIKEKNLLHLLGVTSKALKDNPDFQRLTGGKVKYAEDILKWILQDIDGNQDLLQYQEDILKRIKHEKGFNITIQQFSPKVTTQLLNYHKIRAKSQTFLKYGPLENVSLVAKLQDGKTLSKNSRSTSAMITRAESFKKYPWAYFGRVENQNNSYLETLQIDSSKHKKELFKGSTPAIVKGVKVIGNNGEEGGHVFSEEKQFELFFQAYEEFNTVMDFTELISYFNGLLQKYEDTNENTKGKSR